MQSGIRPPSTVTQKKWPPDYRLAQAWRNNQVRILHKDEQFLADAKAYYAHNLEAFINHWCVTYDPRRAARKLPTKFPFLMFPRQVDFIKFVTTCYQNEESGLVEKSRDMGATWLCVCISIWFFLFHPGTAIGWGSRKQELVDSIGDPSSIFEKIRIQLKAVPQVFLPDGFSHDKHSHFMRLINPENGSTVIGETGDQIGRGGRTLIYFKDESAHYAHAEAIEAALSENTNCQIDMSSVSNTANVFYRKREVGVEWNPGDSIAEGRTNVFIFDWSDHPEKTKKWYIKRRNQAEMNGLLHVFAREVDRDYAASAEGVIIPSEWIKAAIGADEVLNLKGDGRRTAALDVADTGLDTNTQPIRKGVILDFLDEWNGLDTGQTARRAIRNVKPFLKDGRIDHQYDSIGIGAGVKAEVFRLKNLDDEDSAKLPANLKFVAWNAGAKVLKPFDRVNPLDSESPFNKDFFHNLKAQGWWALRMRFYRTWMAVNDPEFTWEEDDLIAISKKIPLTVRQKLIKELSQPTMAQSSGSFKMVINKTPDGSRSPNLADGVMMCYFPVIRPMGRVSLDGIKSFSADKSDYESLRDHEEAQDKVQRGTSMNFTPSR